MRRANRDHFICSLLGLLLLVAGGGFNVASAQDSGVRTELPDNGNLRVENLRGGINLEVWNESYVSITAITNGQLSRKAAIIERTDKLLSVRVAPASNSSEGVLLTVKIPTRTHAAIITSSGTVNIRDMPAALLAQTKSGPIHAEFSPNSDASLIATSSRGAITSSLSTLSAPSGSGVLRTRLGNGDRPVRLSSESGAIILSEKRVLAERSIPAGKNVRTAPDEITEKRPPRLVGGNGRDAQSQASATPAATPEEISDGDVIRVDAQLASVNVSVIDRGTNRGILGLKQKDFRLFEDGAEQKIAQFESSAAPFNLVLLIDLSGSTSDVIDLIRSAAIHFVEAARPFDRISVITFAGNPVVVSPFTTDRAALRERINSIAPVKGGTKLYDAVSFVIEQGFKDLKVSGRNAIVLLSDGLDSTLPNVEGEGSVQPYNDVLRAAQEFDGVLYTIWVDTQIWEPTNPNEIQNDTYDLAAYRMEDLATAGGGVFNEVAKLDDLAGVYDRVVADLGTVYTLAYRPSNRTRDGKWRSVTISVNRPNTVARGKRGYYAR